MGHKKTVQGGLFNFSQPEGLLKGEPEGRKLTRNNDSKKDQQNENFRLSKILLGYWENEEF